MSVDTDLVVDQERALLSAEVRNDPARLDALLHPHFVEIGRSGRLWTRDMIGHVGALDVIPELEVIAVDHLSDDVILLVWRSRIPDRLVLRSSLWQRDDGRWRLRFHQGTPST